MSAKVEGTIVFDGLVEGRLPDDPGFDARLREWVRLLGKLGLRMDLELEGRSFNILADAAPISVRRFVGEPASAVGEALEQLVAAFPDPVEARLFSTLRSVEYAPGEERQVVYLVKPDGSVDTPERTLEADTESAPEPMSSGQRLRVVLGGAAVLALLFGVTSLFVDYGSLLRNVWHSVTPLDTDVVEVEASRFESFFVHVGTERGKGSRSILLELERTPAYPIGVGAFDAAFAEPNLGWQRRLVLEALARGYVAYEVFDKQGDLIRRGFVRVAELAEKETVEVKIPVPRDPRPARLVLSY